MLLFQHITKILWLERTLLCSTRELEIYLSPIGMLLEEFFLMAPIFKFGYNFILVSDNLHSRKDDSEIE